MATNYTLVAKTVRHPAHVVITPSDDRSLCGLWMGMDYGKSRYGWGSRVVVPVAVSLSNVRVCKTCLRSLATARNDTDRLSPDIEPGAIERGLKLSANGVREIPGRLFRVRGESDMYTVTMPSDGDIATTCTCRAAKIHPGTMCKHVVRVLSNETEREVE
jgi:hypothetical protein